MANECKTLHRTAKKGRWVGEGGSGAPRMADTKTQSRKLAAAIGFKDSDDSDFCWPLFVHTYRVFLLPAGGAFIQSSIYFLTIFQDNLVVTMEKLTVGGKGRRAEELSALRNSFSRNRRDNIVCVCEPVWRFVYKCK